jgi:type II secretory pathway component PulF
MAVFAYKAIGIDGLVRGSIAADTARQARDQLRARGLRVEEIRSQSSSYGVAPTGTKPDSSPSFENSPLC